MDLLWPIELVSDGLRNLMRHKLRTALTMLGVLCGVAAVITMLAIGEGAQRTVLSEISALGLQNVILDSVQPPSSAVKSSSGRHGPQLFRYGLTEEDVALIRGACPSASISVAHQVKSKVYAGGERIDARVLGVEPDYFSLFTTELVRGRLLTPLDDIKRHQVAVVTSGLDAELRRSGLVGEGFIRVGWQHFRVVGVVDLSVPGGDRAIFMPYHVARARFGITTVQREAGSVEFTRTDVGQVVIQVADESEVPGTARMIRRILDDRHEVSDVTMSVPLDLLKSKQRTQRILSLVLVSIAAISLLVGGIGIMNIMLAIVTERIPEIGLRRAVGARRRDILMQFLIETVTLSTVGGALGCVVGAAAVPIASHWLEWEGIVTAQSIFLALVVSWIVGVIFGLAPAARAAQMDPVTALRHE
ncbi:MAG: ABC transporter permease [Kiritimatiellia bacterium]|jgi:putative ABC transport system permease protein|nr:ABC transporter permease [Kiritimatiellia bacterium]MDP6809104.1 ABC transporter permease [Kiritimatiellia bacterium]MDP7023204.1 ABC transporter permease [Kiritimatiellia bacterium]